MATEFKLPDAMPTRWLDDIKSSVKEGRKGLIIGTILGSSLITGLVTTALGLFVQVMVEGTKTSLELRAEDAKETVRKYNVLRDNLNDLKYDLATSTVAFGQAKDAPRDKKRREHADKLVDSLVDQVATIDENVAKLDDALTSVAITNSVDPLVEKLQSLQAAHDYKSLDSLCKTSDTEVSVILSLIAYKKEALSQSFRKSWRDVFK